MTGKKLLRRGCVGLAIAIWVACSVWVISERTTSARAKGEWQHARITEAIVARNPEARLKDFGADFPAYLTRVSEARGIDYRLVMALIDKESGWRPDAVGKAGEIGLMQIMPATGKAIAGRLRDETYQEPARSRKGGYVALGSLGDPRTNVLYGIEYLAWQVREFGMGPTALRAYNRSPDRAREHWPKDRYAEDVAMRFLALAGRTR